jgi:hypothetical protein
MGVALALALSGASSAVAKAPLRASHHQAKVQAKPSVVARAAGHKIA